MPDLDAWIVNADDLGASPGVNKAIYKGATEGGLTHASLFANGAYFEPALADVVRKTVLRIGLHANLTTGVAVSQASDIPLLAGGDGRFRHGFMSLWQLSRGRHREELRLEIQREIEAQLAKLREHGINVSHIDGHRHVQMIPLIFSVVRELAESRGIGRIRMANESLWRTFRATRSARFLSHGALLKHLLLKHFYRKNGCPSRIYFFSMLHTCRIRRAFLPRLRIPDGYDGIEIMLHPGMPEVDRAAGFTDPHLLSPCRTEELQVALDLKNRP